MIDFVSQDCMEQLAAKCSWVHVLIPGQGDGDRDLPPNYNFPTMQQLGEAMGEVCDAMGLKQVVLFGEGAGANILARLAMLREDLVLGAVLIHCTGTAAGFAETIRDKLIGWKLNSIGMNPAAESYMLLHRFGSIGDATDEMEMRHALDRFRHSLREAINPRNLNKFIMSFMANQRASSVSLAGLLQLCCVFISTSSLTYQDNRESRLAESARTDPDRLKHIELVQLDDVGNVLRGAPDKVSDCLQYFIQGLGL
ncbi:Ndr family protein, partial [Opisthorchis viverrini]